MWAQLVKMRVKPGSEGRLEEADREWEEKVGRRSDSGWLRTLRFTSANDPSEYYELVFFESEEKARANERTPEHLAVVEKLMGCADGEPEFLDLTPAGETTR